MVFVRGKFQRKWSKKMFGDRVRGEVTGDIIQTTYFEAFATRGFNTCWSYRKFSQPKPRKVLNTRQNLKFIRKFPWQGLRQIEVARPVAEVTDNDLGKMIEKLREQKKEWQPVERASQEKDQITIHFSGVSEGENFTDGKVEDFQVEIGAKQMIPGFEG